MSLTDSESLTYSIDMTMTPEETLEFNQRLWRDAAFRKAQIDKARLHSAIVAAIFTTARVNGFSESAAIEVALIAIAEESDQFREIAVKAIGRRL